MAYISQTFEDGEVLYANEKEKCANDTRRTD